MAILACKLASKEKGNYLTDVVVKFDKGTGPEEDDIYFCDPH